MTLGLVCCFSLSIHVRHVYPLREGIHPWCCVHILLPIYHHLSMYHHLSIIIPCLCAILCLLAILKFTALVIPCCRRLTCYHTWSANILQGFIPAWYAPSFATLLLTYIYYTSRWSTTVFVCIYGYTHVHRRCSILSSNCQPYCTFYLVVVVVWFMLCCSWSKLCGCVSRGRGSPARTPGRR